MAKSQKRRLAGLKAARTRKRRASARRAAHSGGHRHRNPGRRTYRRRTVTVYKNRSRRRNSGHHVARRRTRRYSNPGMMSGDFGAALQIIAGAFITNLATGFLPSGLNTGIPGYIAIALIAVLQGKAVGKLLKNPRLGNNLTVGGFVYLALKIAGDYLPSLGLPISVSGLGRLGLVGPSSFWTPQVPMMGSMGNFVQPNMLRSAIPPPATTANAMRGLGTVRRVGRMR